MKPGMGWPIGIAIILGATVAGNLAMMRVANDDPSMAIEPDYYKKAVAFDSSMARERRSNALRWRAITTLDPVVAGAPTQVHVQLLDSMQLVITDATVHVVALYNARANETQSLTLQLDTGGRYSGPLTIAHPGQWEIRVEAVRNGARYMNSSRVEAIGARATPGARP